VTGRRPPQQATRQERPARPGSRGPRAPRPPVIAPAISAVGVIALLVGSWLAIAVWGPSGGSAEPTEAPLAFGTPDASGNLPEEPVATATPRATIVITPPPERTAEVIGQILFTKGGDIYRVTGKGDIQALTRKGLDSAPSWTPDGKRIVFVETRDKTVQAPWEGRLAKYRFFYPNIMSIAADGSDRKQIYESIFPSGGGQWHSWVLQPDVSPDGERIAVVSDGKDGYGEVVLHTMSSDGGRLQALDLEVIDAQGHNDPDWSPDGKRIAFTYNIRSGQIGTPKIGIVTVRSEKMELLREGYANPSWSPDGRWIAAERTTGTGRDIVILDPESGAEVARLTNDGDSFAPTFSPNGNQIAFLRRKGLGVDLWVLTLDPARGFTRLEQKPVTEDGGLDAESPPSWFIPEELIVPMATPEVVAEPVEPGPSAGPSPAP